jgi:hypothetical protein
MGQAAIEEPTGQPPPPARPADHAASDQLVDHGDAGGAQPHQAQRRTAHQHPPAAPAADTRIEPEAEARRRQRSPIPRRWPGRPFRGGRQPPLSVTRP